MSDNIQSQPQVQAQAPKAAQQQPPLIIGIGASAGGLEALQQFFDCMPGNSGLSFVVIQHLSPDYKSLMADILSKHTDMPVIQVISETPVQADTVYLIPPKKYMTLKHNHLVLSDYAAGTLTTPSTSSSPPWQRSARSTPSWRCSPAPVPTAPTA